MADYGPLTPSNRLEWFLMNGGSGGSGGGGGSDFKMADVEIVNDTEENVYCVIGGFNYFDGTFSVFPSMFGIASGNSFTSYFYVPESAESVQYQLYITGAYDVSAEGASVSPGGEWTDITIGDTTFKQYTITAEATIEELIITISEVG